MASTGGKETPIASRASLRGEGVWDVVLVTKLQKRPLIPLLKTTEKSFVCTSHEEGNVGIMP
jgi:hypothetical protein